MEYDAAPVFQTIHDEPGRRSPQPVSGSGAALKRTARIVCMRPGVRSAR
ncbi:hypothetical protein [Burkholderia cenocepacia]|jgi:hypothetical protein|nr:hypothetical protein [Burkholderia cenocepacia]